MHIVHVTHRAWPVIGGSERYVQEIAQRQAGDGHRVTVIATDAVDLSALWSRRGRTVDPATPDERFGVRIRRLPVRCFPLGAFVFPALRRAAWLTGRICRGVALGMARFSPWVPGLRRALIDESADLIVGWSITLEGLVAEAAYAARRKHVPWVAVPLLHLGRDRFYTMPHQMRLLREAQVVLAQTPTERAFLLDHGLAADRVRIASPGVDPARAKRADGKRFRQKHGIDGQLVLSIGALGYDKGTLHLIEAAERLRNEGRHLTVVLVGSLQESLFRSRRLLADTDASCRYLGEVSEDEKWDAIDAANVVAMPSRTESFGIVFLEAWACAKPVIGARVGAVPDVVRDSVDGLLVDFGDIDGLAEALRKLLNDRALAAEMGRRGREKIRHVLNWDHQYERWRTVLEGLG